MASISRLLEIIILHVMISHKSAKPLKKWSGDVSVQLKSQLNSVQPHLPAGSFLNTDKGSSGDKTRTHWKLITHHRGHIGSHLEGHVGSHIGNHIGDYSESVINVPSLSRKKTAPHKHRHKHKLKGLSIENEILSNKASIITAKPEYGHSQNEVMGQKNVTSRTYVMKHVPKESSNTSLIHKAKMTKVFKYSPFPDSTNVSWPNNLRGLSITKSEELITPRISGGDNDGLSSLTVLTVTSQTASAPSSKVNIKYKPRNGPNLPLLSHFHIPNFGMVDANSYPRRPPIKGTHSIEGTFLWAVGLFGSVENGAIFLTAVFSKNFRKPLHILVGTIAGTDLFVCLIYIPTYTYFLLEGNRNLAEQAFVQTDPYETIFTDESPFSFCNISRAIFVEVASVTLTIKALIALYLYILTCSRSRARTLFSPRNTGFFIFLALLLNFVVLFLPSFVGYDKVDFYPNAFVCGVPAQAPRTMGNWSIENVSAVYSTMTLSLHLLELSVICFCFIHVHRAILKGKVYSDTYRDKDSQAKINYTRALKIMVLIFASFLVCWLPVYIVNVIDPDHAKLPSDVHHLVMDLLLLKSAINPTIYVYGMRSLRYEMKLLCMCKCRAEDRHKYIVKPQVTSFLEAATRSADTACEAAE